MDLKETYKKKMIKLFANKSKIFTITVIQAFSLYLQLCADWHQKEEDDADFNHTGMGASCQQCPVRKYVSHHASIRSMKRRIHVLFSHVVLRK